MGMSQEEIDAMKAENGGSAPGAYADIVNRFAFLLGGAIQNILPILVGAADCETSTDSRQSDSLSGIIKTLPPDTVYFSFKQAKLTKSAMIGLLSLPLAINVSRKMMGQDDAAELTEALLSALSEAVNNILGAYDTAVSDEIGGNYEHAEVTFVEKDQMSKLPSAAGLDPDTPVEFVILNVSCNGDSGKIGLILPAEALQDIAGKIPSAKVPETRPEPAKPAIKEPAMKAPEIEIPTITAHTPAPEKQAPQPAHLEISRAVFEDLKPSKPTGETRGVELILDVPLDVTVELGRKTLNVRDILGLVPGSLVELDKLAGESVDLMVNGKLFARGEVVVIDENFGVRVSSIITPQERLEHLR